MKNFEGPSADLKKFIETSNGAGLSREDKRSVMDAVQGSKEKHRYYEEDKLIDRIDSESVEEFTKLIAGDDNIDHKNLVDIGNTLREYGTRGNKEKMLTPAEQKIVSLVIKYIENWFYSDGVIKMIEKEKKEYGNDSNNDLAAAAFIINQLAKIKENPQYSETVKNIDSEKLSKFIDEVSDNIPDYFSIDKLDIQINKLKDEKLQKSKEISEKFDTAKKEAEPSLDKMRKAEEEFAATVRKSVSVIQENIDVFPKSLGIETNDLVKLLEKIIEDLRGYKIPCRASVIQDTLSGLKSEWNSKKESDIRYKDDGDYYSREKKSLHEKLEEAKEEVEKKIKRMENSVKSLLKYIRDEANKAKEADSKKPTQKFSGFDALQSLGASLPKFNYKNILEAFEKIAVKSYQSERNQYFDCRKQVQDIGYYDSETQLSRDQEERYRPSQELDALQTARQRYSEILKEFEKSKIIVKSALAEKDGPAALYFMKSFLMIAAEKRKREQKYFNPRSISYSPEKRKPVYNFEHGEERSFGRDDFINENKTFNRVHFEPLHVMCAQFALEYQWQKYNKTF